MTKHTDADGAFGSPKRATTKERVAMAAGWNVADAIPDALFVRAGTAIVRYWEVDALAADRLDRLKWFAQDLGALAQATAFPVETARNVVHAFVAALMARECSLPDDPQAIADGWFESGRGLDPMPVVWGWESGGFGDPKHKPTNRPASVVDASR